MAKYLTQAGETVIAGLASDDTPRHLKLDTATRGLQVISHNEHAVNAGKHFYLTYPFTLTATTDTQDFIIDTYDSTQRAHMSWNMTGSAITEIWVYEDTTVTTTDAIPFFNNNRNSTDAGTVAIYNGGVIASSTDNGTMIWHQKSGAATQYSRSSMQVGAAQPIVLKQDALYRIHYETGTATNLCNLNLMWCEHTDLT